MLTRINHDQNPSPSLIYLSQLPMRDIKDVVDIVEVVLERLITLDGERTFVVSGDGCREVGHDEGVMESGSECRSVK